MKILNINPSNNTIAKNIYQKNKPVTEKSSSPFLNGSDFPKRKINSNYLSSIVNVSFKAQSKIAKILGEEIYSCVTNAIKKCVYGYDFLKNDDVDFKVQYDTKQKCYWINDIKVGEKTKKQTKNDLVKEKKKLGKTDYKAPEEFYFGTCLSLTKQVGKELLQNKEITKRYNIKAFNGEYKSGNAKNYDTFHWWLALEPKNSSDKTIIIDPSFKKIGLETDKDFREKYSPQNSYRLSTLVNKDDLLIVNKAATVISENNNFSRLLYNNDGYLSILDKYKNDKPEDIKDQSLAYKIMYKGGYGLDKSNHLDLEFLFSLLS